MRRHQSAPDSLSLLSTDSDLSSDHPFDLYSAISEEDIATKRDSTSYSFSNDTNESLQDIDISDGRQLEPDDDMSDQTIESAPPSVSCSFNEPSYLTGEMIEKMKSEADLNAGGAVTDGDVREEELGEVVEGREEILTDNGVGVDNTEEMGNVEVLYCH